MDAKRLSPAPLARGAFWVMVVLTSAWAAMCVWAQPSLAVGPSVELSFSPPAPLIGELVTFTAVGEPEEGSELQSYRWDLDGDGVFELNTGLLPIATFIYTDAGVFSPTVQLRDTWGNRPESSKILIAGGDPPVASFAVSPGAPFTGQPVLFVSTSTDADGTIADLAWDLNGDGLFDNGSGPSALRSFATPGQYVIGLRATDNEAHTSFSSQAITVAAAPGVSAAPVSLRLLNPFPVVRISGSLTKRGARLRTVAVDAPPGATVRVSCRGRSCPYRARTSVVSKRTSSLRLSRLERRLRAGVQIRIFVTSPGTIGKYMSFRIRRGQPPRRLDRCVNHGSTKPIPCQT
jgi:hypothetical protein